MTVFFIAPNANATRMHSLGVFQTQISVIVVVSCRSLDPQDIPLRQIMREH